MCVCSGACIICTDVTRDPSMISKLEISHWKRLIQVSSRKETFINWKRSEFDILWVHSASHDDRKTLSDIHRLP